MSLFCSILLVGEGAKHTERMLGCHPPDPPLAMHNDVCPPKQIIIGRFSCVTKGSPFLGNYP